jgi:PAS domain S-box-containing protein
VNDTLCEMTGYTPKELLERTLFELTHPDDLNQTLELLEKQSKTSPRSRQIEKRLVRKDGQSIWVHVAKHVVSAHQGNPGYFAAVIVDISEVKKSEKQLAENL